MKKPVVLLQIFLVATLLSAAQEAKTTTSKPASKPAQSPKQSQKKNAKPEPPPLTKVQPEDVLAHLEQSIAWYRQVRAAEQLSGVPSDLVVRDVTMNRALQSLQLAFDFARAEAAFLAAAFFSSKNCSSSVEPCSAVVEAFAPCTACVMASK